MKANGILCFSVVCLLTVLSACNSDPVNISEVLQKPAGTRLYTKHNLWYENPSEISSRNYQKGKMLRMGSEIADLTAVDEEIKFRVIPSNKIFTIKFERRREMIPIDDYLRRLFGEEDSGKLKKKLGSKLFDKLYNGQIEIGMSRDDVIKAYGYPSAHRTPSLTDDTWIYWEDPLHSKRVIFKDNKITNIVKF